VAVDDAGEDVKLRTWRAEVGNVQIYEGSLDPMGQIAHPQIVEMNLDPYPSSDSVEFTGSVTCRGSGLHGFTVRVLPHHADLPNPVSLGLVLWA